MLKQSTKPREPKKMPTKKMRAIEIDYDEYPLSLGIVDEDSTFSLSRAGRQGHNASSSKKVMDNFMGMQI